MGVDHDTYLALGFSCEETALTEEAAAELLSNAHGWVVLKPWPGKALVVYYYPTWVDLGSHRGDKALVVDISGILDANMMPEGNALRQLLAEADPGANISPLGYVSVHESG
ncbi:hypothetical protein QKT49_gp407 [Acanthamoeba castellanii medusavirus]|uniref:Uncharacterized protein n=1 Tax=Acanthamoeba castellanii medusavirus J1 TaxID=3114988 RepID=A0A3T1CX05_9VIRU|nr:hypothetical protein QKT49_gp407 [Acanthamoeba castellanii medusavirus]BBI30356.1 hypothetical protein [Acanthamoeba castellanii medusavirus J1]